MQNKIHTREELIYLACLIDRGGALGMNINQKIAAATSAKFSITSSNKEFIEELGRMFPGRAAADKSKTDYSSKTGKRYKDMYIYQMRLEHLKYILPQVLPYLRLEKSRKLCILILQHMDINLRGKSLSAYPDIAQKKFELAMEILEMIRGFKL